MPEPERSGDLVGRDRGGAKDRLGSWLTREQARELLAVPDRSTLKVKCDACVLSLLVGCALRRRELAALKVEDVQMRENRWVLANLRGEGNRVRTVAVTLWVKQAIKVWQTAAGIEEGRLFRSVRKGGREIGSSLSDWAVWDVVRAAAEEIGVEGLWGARPPPHLRHALQESWR